jgi:hypothetical protein
LGIAYHLIRRLEQGESGEAELIRQLGAKAEVPRDLSYRLYTICERRKWAQEAIAYNALVLSWGDVQRLAGKENGSTEAGTITDAGNENGPVFVTKRACLLSEKRIQISDNRFFMKVAKPIDKKMLARIRTHGDGWVFSASDFVDLGMRQAVDKALSRMTAAGAVRRVARGLYDVPRQHPIVGTVGPSVDRLSKALAGKGGTKLQPTGAYAANLLGLSDQVPAKVVFLTDGRSKRIRVGKLDIVLKQTSPRIMATAGSVSGTVIQALRYLGKTHVTNDTVKRLDRKLSDDDRKQLLKDIAYAPVWIGNIMRRLATKP